MLSRRGFLSGAVAGIITAPAIVRPSSLMRIKPFNEQDGIALTSVPHPYNNFVAPDLNEASLSQAIIDLRRCFTKPLTILPTRIIVPSDWSGFR